MVLTPGIPPDFRGGVRLFTFKPPYGIGSVVPTLSATQLRTNDVHCRGSAGTGPVVLKVVTVTGAAILKVTMDQFICASPFPRPLLV